MEAVVGSVLSVTMADVLTVSDRPANQVCRRIELAAGSAVGARCSFPVAG